MIVVLCLPVVIYCIIIIFFLYQFISKKHSFEIPLIGASKKCVSIIIPFRNEEENISTLINCLSLQDYPTNLVEILFINDHSEDLSFELCNKYIKNLPFTSRILSLEDNQTGKKAALELGISEARYPLILITDADCIMGSKWIYTHCKFSEIYKSRLIIAPVLLNSTNNFFSKFMAIEQLSLTATTASAAFAKNPILCSGANLAFYKSDYLNFLKNNTIAHPSGDDMFFLIFMKHMVDLQQKSSNHPHKILPIILSSKKAEKRNNKAIHFIPSFDAAVFTNAPASLRDFINQRKRWVSKSRYYKDLLIIFVAITVALANLSIVLSFIMGFFKSQYLIVFLLLLIGKCLVDFPLLYAAAAQFKQKKIMRIFLGAQLIYPFFVTFMSIYGNFGTFNWKKRSY
jgi:cellulose synthase/poly-beta-1,6-N-acetylglucosamine synthase-like glycosyltransferase